MGTMRDLEKELQIIKERNLRVEADKAWETSYARRSIIAVGTYLFSLILFFMINAPQPLLAALVPTLGFVFSTLTLPIIRNLWLSRKSA